MGGEEEISQGRNSTILSNTEYGKEFNLKDDSEIIDQAQSLEHNSIS